MKKMIYILSIVVSFFIGMLYGKLKKKSADQKIISAQTDEINKFREFFGILNYWLTLKEENKNLEIYFQKYNYKTIAIYGMKDLGTHLYEELKDSSIAVSYGIDKNADCIYADIDVVFPNKNMPKVDAVVVTSIHYYQEIKAELQELTNVPIVSLADIMKEI